MLVINDCTKTKIWLALYVFVFVFDPPYLPIDPVYIIGVLTFLYVNTHKEFYHNWPYDLNKYRKFITIFLVYLIIVSLINFLLRIKICCLID